MGEPVLPPMTSQRPYLLRALYEWIADNGLTPHIVVNATAPGVRVPAHAVKDGQVVLNIADRAVGRLEMGNDAVRFSARFGGVSQNVVAPVEAILAIYARETGQGMALPAEEPAPGGAAHAEVSDASTTSETPEARSPVGAPTGPRPAGPDDKGPDEPPRRGAHLRIVK